MRLQYRILLFMAMLNLSVGVCVALAVPGTAYVSPLVAGNISDAEAYEQQFNATSIGEGWQMRPYSGIPMIGDIFSAFYFFFANFRFLIDGFPYLLDWISDSLIVNAEAKTAFTIMANLLRAVYAILMATFLIEFIGGRQMTD